MYPIFTAQPVLLEAFRRGETTGFAEFGPEHLAWLAVCVLLIVLTTKRYVRLRKDERRQTPPQHASPSATSDALPGAASSVPAAARSLRQLRVMAAAIMTCLVSEDALMVATGTFWPAWWPLHFCNFAEFCCVIYAVRPNLPCRELLLTVGIMGSACALLFPGWSYCLAYTWPVVCGFVEHALIFATSLCALSDWHELPRWRDLWITAVFMVCYTLFFRWFNVTMGANFGFVTSPAAGSPLEDWEQLFGNPGYLVPYGAAFAVGAVLFHGCTALQRSFGRRDAGGEETHRS